MSAALNTSPPQAYQNVLGQQPFSAAEAAPPVSEDMLARIVAETERQITAKANRPTPIRLRTLDELERFAEIASRSTAVPKDYQGKWDNCIIAIQMGAELGLAPMQSLQNIAVINGRPSVWGDAMPGLCRASGMMAYMREWSDGEGETLAWHCETKRRDDPNPIVQHFSVADAKVAKLWDKPIWQTSPGRMLQMRARGFALRDAFPDVLRGLISVEEARDYITVDKVSSAQENVTPSPENVAIPTGEETKKVTPSQDNAATQKKAAAAAMPAAPRKRQTIADWLEAHRIALNDCESREAVDEILESEEMQRARETFTNGAKTKLESMISEALERWYEQPTEEEAQGDDLEDIAALALP